MTESRMTESQLRRRCLALAEHLASVKGSRRTVLDDARKFHAAITVRIQSTPGVTAELALDMFAKAISAATGHRYAMAIVKRADQLLLWVSEVDRALALQQAPPAALSQLGASLAVSLEAPSATPQLAAPPVDPAEPEPNGADAYTGDYASR